MPKAALHMPEAIVSRARIAAAERGFDLDHFVSSIIGAYLSDPLCAGRFMLPPPPSDCEITLEVTDSHYKRLYREHRPDAQLADLVTRALYLYFDAHDACYLHDDTIDIPVKLSDTDWRSCTDAAREKGGDTSDILRRALADTVFSPRLLPHFATPEKNEPEVLPDRGTLKISKSLFQRMGEASEDPTGVDFLQTALRLYLHGGNALPTLADAATTPPFIRAHDRAISKKLRL